MLKSTIRSLVGRISKPCDYIQARSNHSLSSASQRKIAVLIDGDNAAAATIGEVLLQANQYGKITIKRIYGDWTNPYM
jgi:hypothetical protein